MNTPTPTSTPVAIPLSRRSEPRRIALGIPVRVRTGDLKDCEVTVRVQALGLQQNGERKPFVVTITPQPGWSPPSSPGIVVFEGAAPVSLCASASEVEQLLAVEGLTWR
jgi:hypothetical protein